MQLSMCRRFRHSAAHSPGIGERVFGFGVSKALETHARTPHEYETHISGEHKHARAHTFDVVEFESSECDRYAQVNALSHC